VSNSTKVVVVTGGASGIGRAICDEMAQAGWVVVVADINYESAGRAASDLESLGHKALAVNVDITMLNSAEAMAARVIENLGSIEALVNCAGWDKFELFLENDPAIWDRLININLKGPIYCTRAILPHMVAKKQGRIVNIASDAGRVGSLGEAVYSACKGGTIAFTKTIAREMARHKITANCICPGPTETPLLANFLPKDREAKILEAYVRSTPLGRLAKPTDIAPAVAFLCSEGAAFITGQVLSVSGGLTMNG
jgi:2-hydroxycyclohexanecarboxyl-CoA dehydrogenase